MENIIAIYKETGPTSHDVVDAVRKITGIKKVGHAGTLDPLARGVLVVGIGKEATQRLAHEVAKEKEYFATIKLGEESSTDDEEGIKTVHTGIQPPAREKIETTLKTFEGEIIQTPPFYSAVKIHGKSAYARVRAGETFTIKPRTVYIKVIELLRYHWPFLTIRVVTGPGVYIRSLARDIGKILDTGAYLKDLERTRVGEYSKEKTFSLKEFTRAWEQNLRH